MKSPIELAQKNRDVVARFLEIAAITKAQGLDLKIKDITPNMDMYIKTGFNAGGL